MDRERANAVNLYSGDELGTLIGFPTSKLHELFDGTPKASTHTISKATISPTFSTISTASSSSRPSDSDSASRRSSTSTAPSTVPPFHRNILPPFTPTPPPWHWNQPAAMTPIEYDYELHCEFAVHKCGVSFHPTLFEEWINHSITHFLGSAPPPRAICIFCDGPDSNFQNARDPYSNWRQRMLHIGRHYQEHHQSPRPDYFLIEYLKQRGIISLEEYAGTMGYTERIACANLVEYGFQSPEMKTRESKKAKVLEQPHDLRKEERQMRKERGKGKKNETYRSSERPWIFQEEHHP